MTPEPKWEIDFCRSDRWMIIFLMINVFPFPQWAFAIVGCVVFGLIETRLVQWWQRRKERRAA